MERIILAVIITALFGNAAAHAETINTDISKFTKWNRVVKAEHVKPYIGTEGLDVYKLMEGEAERYAGVDYKEDADNYHVADYWATRAEMMKRNAGDCEDFAIAAYFDLLEAGVPEAEMHIVVVKDRQTRELHAYLQAYGLVLDRRGDFKVMAATQAFIKYEPYYSINRLGWADLRRAQ